MSTKLSDISVAILAGGLATRLRPLTEKIPKSLVEVGGEPFLAHQLKLLAKQNIKHVVVCLGYLGEEVVKQFGDGKYFGLELDYIFDGPSLLGTGGAIRKSLPKLGEKFFVLYGDSYLPIPFLPVSESFDKSGKNGLMTVYRNKDLHDRSNVVYKNGVIKIYNKKTSNLKDMEYIDYGLSMFNSSVFGRWPTDKAFDLEEVLQKLLEDGDLAGFEVRERFYEIGSHKGLNELEEKLKN